MALIETIYVSERRVLTELLELYRDSPWMWDPSHVLFGNRAAKEDALAVMLEKYKELIQDANMDTLKKKIEIMRTSYRREYKKAMANKQHKPNLWYYSLMSFLNEKTTNCQTEHYEEKLGGKTESYQPKPAKRTKPSTTVFLSEYSDPEDSTYNLQIDEMAETDAFGRALGLQLNELSPMQKIIAEKLISDIVYYARLDKLTTNTSLINLNDDYL